MNLAFPLCREPRHEARIRDALGACVRLLAERLPGPRLRAVVLTGSFARGEGSVLPQRAGLRVLGDLEFFVVVEGAGEARRLHAAAAGWAREARTRLLRHGVIGSVEFGPVETAFFRRRARPSIFVADLRQHGKVLWGERQWLEAIPPFAPAAIPREDAVRLLFNRMIEQLDAHDRLERAADDDLLDLAYQRVKLVLDLAGSALAFVGAHTALYRRRPAAFARLAAETPSLVRALPADYQDALAEAALIKLDPAAHSGWLPGGTADARRVALRRAIVETVPLLAAFLAWELREWLEGSADVPPALPAARPATPLPALLDRYRRTPSPVRWARDWAKLALHPLPPPLPLARGKALRLALGATPRTLLYTAGALAYLGLGGLADPTEVAERVRRGLFVPDGTLPADAAALRRAIVALWTWAARNS